MFGAGTALLTAVAIVQWIAPPMAEAARHQRPAGIAHARRGDFNADGYDDLAVGVPAEDTSAQDAGAVNVLYGSGAGLSDAGNQFWTRDSTGVLGGTGSGDAFGFSLAAGDFNGDGVGDLAIGAPSDDVGSALDAGAVNVLYGSAGVGLSSTGNQLWTGDQLAVGLAASERFGNALAAGDFNGDGADDLAIGVPGRSVGGVPNAGGVQVVYGGPTGLSAQGNVFMTQGEGGGLPGAVTPGDSVADLGLAAANFGLGPEDDLAIGNPLDDVQAVDDGSVDVAYGSPTGLSSTDGQLWSQGSSGVKGISEPGDLFGWDVAAADFGGRKQADLAIGAPGEDLGHGNSIRGAGEVTALYGGPEGLSGRGSQVWRQGWDGVPGTPAGGDGFGNALAAADMGRTAEADLVVGASGDKVGTAGHAGSATVLYGSAGGLDSVGVQLWSQDSSGVRDVAEPGDFFGSDVVAFDLDGSGSADVVAGVTQESVGVNNAIRDAGAINVLYGGTDGLSSAGNQFWDQDTGTVGDQAENFDAFGSAMG